jgi:hypothetical protein
MATPQLNDVARLRGGGFQSLDDLALLIATSLEGLSRQQSFRRGLPDSKFVQVGGGTKVAIDDNSISRKSRSLQPPQTMIYREHGGVGARHQLRADVETRTVPAVIIAVDGEGEDALLTVVPIGDEPAAYISASSGQLQSGNPLNDLGFGVDLGGPRYQVRMSGTQFATGTNPGPVAPTVGQTTMVTLSTQSEKVTTTIERNRQYMPMVGSREGATQAALVNNFCCQEDTGGGGGGGS